MRKLEKEKKQQEEQKRERGCVFLIEKGSASLFDSFTLCENAEAVSLCAPCTPPCAIPL